MLLSSEDLKNNPDLVEDIEKATLRLVFQALADFRIEASRIFEAEQDLPGDIGEDITREALDRMGMSKIPQRLYGKIDYKQARYVFHPNYTVRQALFVDSKAEKVNGLQTATIQLSQTSMMVIQRRRDEDIRQPGGLKPIIEIDGKPYLTTTIFVKYHYTLDGVTNRLKTILVIGLPNGLLQQRYNPSVTDTIWRAGRNASGEPFRVRIHFPSLQCKARWRVQEISLWPEEKVEWTE